MKELIELIAKSLVDNRPAVQVRELVKEREVILELTVGEGDLGKVIGKEGRTARAIRTVLGAAGMKHRKRYRLEIVE